VIAWLARLFGRPTADQVDAIERVLERAGVLRTARTSGVAVAALRVRRVRASNPEPGELHWARVLLMREVKARLPKLVNRSLWDHDFAILLDEVETALESTERAVVEQVLVVSGLVKPSARTLDLCAFFARRVADATAADCIDPWVQMRQTPDWFDLCDELKRAGASNALPIAYEIVRRVRAARAQSA
jgi:hypothetical protein